MDFLLEVFGVDFQTVGQLAAFFGAFILLSVEGLKVLVPDWMEGNERYFVFGHAAVLSILGVVALIVPDAGEYVSLGLGLYSAAVLSALSYEVFGRAVFEQLGLQQPREE